MAMKLPDSASRLLHPTDEAPDAESSTLAPEALIRRRVLEALRRAGGDVLAAATALHEAPTDPPDPARR
ncbi:MAG: hypothetical protein H6744_03195 [Deltaproteobacteria bacterium]|nr:hypothetical protein [Deltaproteobacteria bacterium]